MNHRYRGKREDNGEWVYGWLIIKSLLYGTSASIRVQDDDGGLDTDYRVYWPTVGAEIGIQDNTDTDVYEGDILLVKGNPEITKKEYLNQKYVMEWNENQYKWWGKPLNTPHNSLFLSHVSKDAKIVGTIYDKS